MKDDTRHTLSCLFLGSLIGAAFVLLLMAVAEAL